MWVAKDGVQRSSALRNEAVWHRCLELSFPSNFIWLLDLCSLKHRNETEGSAISIAMGVIQAISRKTGPNDTRCERPTAALR
jgi:hypothetical protein